MRAIILAAGHGERMKPLTSTTPKPLLTVNHKPLIAYNIERLAKAGVVDIVVNHSCFGEQIEAYLGDGGAFGVHICYSSEDGLATLETAGGIINALPLLGKAPFITVNADVWTDFPFAKLLDVAMTDRLAYIVLVDNPPHHPEGDFYLADGVVKNNGDTRLTFSGIGLFTTEFFKMAPPPDADGYIHARLAPLLRKAIAENRVTGQHYQGTWHDIGTPERLQALREATET